MTINFNSVELTNFMSFNSAKVNLNNEGYVLVKGTNNNEDDNALSNGSGKSSIWESIVWALTGSTIRGTKEVQRLNCGGTCKVELDFNVDDDNYILTRTKEPSNLILIKNGEDISGKGIKDTSKILKDYLPDLTPELIGSVIILGQGLPMKFTNNSPSGRKEVLEKLSKSDFMIEDLKRRVGDRAQELSTEIRTREDNRLKISTNVDNYNAELNKYIDAIDKLNNTELLNSLNAEVKSLTKELSEVNDEIQKCKTMSISMSDMADKLQATLDKDKNTYNENRKKIDETYDPTVDALKEEISKLMSDVRVLNHEIKKLESVTDVCPTCGQKLPNVEIIDTTDKHAEVDRINSVIKEKTSYKDEVLSEKTKDIKAIEENYSVRYNQLSEEIKRDRALSKDYTNSISTLSDKKVELEKKINDKTNLINNSEVFKKQYQDRVNEINVSLKKLEDELLYNNKELEDYISRQSVIKKMTTCITREFRGYLLEDIINYINNKAKEYSQEVFNTDKIDFKLDGNNISISYCEKEYENLSGGERCRCDIILQLALRDMLCKYLNFSSNIFVLDEGLDYLDPLGCEKVLQLIYSKLTDVNTIYVITHHTDLPITADYELNIVKDKEGISRIE